MEPRPQKQGVDIQKNLNTVLLTLCCMGIGWVLKEVNNLDVRMATQEYSRSADHDTIVEITRVANEQSKIISNIDMRLNRLETLQSEKQPKQ